MNFANITPIHSEKIPRKLKLWISGYFGWQVPSCQGLSGYVGEPDNKGSYCMWAVWKRISSGSRNRDSIIVIWNYGSVWCRGSCIQSEYYQDAKSDLAHLLLSQFYWSRGYCKSDLCTVISEVDRSGKLDELHSKNRRDIREEMGWHRKNHHCNSFYETACSLLPENFPLSLSKPFQAEQEELVNIFLVQECLSYLKEKANAPWSFASSLEFLMRLVSGWSR